MRRRFELRLRLAMHLAPRSAIGYERRNSVPRWRLVRDHLVAVFERAPDETEGLAREIAVVLDSWEAQRTDVGHRRDYLIRRDGSRCGTCRVNFIGGPPYTLTSRDEYKPYFTSPDELLSIEVDHVEAISALGTNDLENLQLLCRLCNAGKADGLGVETRVEARHAGQPVGEVPVAHRARMLYYVIERDRRSCSLCGRKNDELTVRPLTADGGYLRSNLRAICVECVAVRLTPDGVPSVEDEAPVYSETPESPLLLLRQRLGMGAVLLKTKRPGGRNAQGFRNLSASDPGRVRTDSQDARNPPFPAGFVGGRYWARTSDPQLVELVLSQLS